MASVQHDRISVVQHKRGAAEDMTAHNPFLAEGEFGVETDTLKVKVGDGIRRWADLPYISGGAGIRVDTLEHWESTNPELGVKELAFGFDAATGNRLFKLSIEKTAWNSLPEVPFVLSNTTPAANSGRIKNMVYMTQTQYADLATKDAHTLYVILQN